MNRLILPLLVMMLGLAGCHTASNEYTVESMDIDATSECVDSNCSIIHFESPNGNDLVLETAHHVIQIDGQPGVSYSYYVWAGDKDMESDDADLIVQDGQAMVLITE